METLSMPYSFACGVLHELDADQLLRLRMQIDVELDRRRVPRNERHVMAEVNEGE